MKKSVYLLFLGLIYIASGLSAQDTRPVMTFKDKEFNFETLKEEDGKVTHTFEFANTGEQPVIIKNVRSSCGCTSPNWSREPVAPGKKGFIQVTFDPKNRPGPFNKSITINSNSKTPVHVLRISGKVTPKPKTVADLYPRNMGKLLLKNNHLSFTKIKNTETKEESLHILNSSKEPMKLTFKNVPSHIKIKTMPETIKPEGKGSIVATYDAGKKQDWGFVIDYINVVVNDDASNRNRLTVSATIEEDFSKLTDEELANSAKVEFEEKVFDFGELKQGEKAEHTFIMNNNGKSDLIIRKTKATCGCTAISPEKELIKPGEKAEIKVVFDSRGKRGRQNKMITVITNDPKTTATRLRVTGNVVKPRS